MSNQCIPEFAQSSQFTAVETRQHTDQGDLPLEDVTAQRGRRQFVQEDAVMDAYARAVAGFFRRLDR